MYVSYYVQCTVHSEGCTPKYNIVLIVTALRHKYVQEYTFILMQYEYVCEVYSKTSNFNLSLIFY